MLTATRPDIAAAAGVLSQYMPRPSKDHWMGVKRVLRYLKGTSKYGLQFSTGEEGEPKLVGYSGADWAGDVDTRRSTSGYVFQIAKSTISWSSRKQSTVAKSSTEAEYVALSSAAQEALWLRRRLLKSFVSRWMPQPPSMKTTKASLNWIRMQSTTAEPNTLTFVTILFAKEFFQMKSE